MSLGSHPAGIPSRSRALSHPLRIAADTVLGGHVDLLRRVEGGALAANEPLVRLLEPGVKQVHDREDRADLLRLDAPGRVEHEPTLVLHPLLAVARDADVVDRVRVSESAYPCDNVASKRDQPVAVPCILPCPIQAIWPDCPPHLLRDYETLRLHYPAREARAMLEGSR